jgi:hypothetical protein
VERSILAVLAVLAGCGSSPDNWPEGRPKIDELRFTQQSPQDPFKLEFVITFSDSDGNTGRGKLHLLLDDEEVSDLALEELFSKQLPSLALDTTLGEFEVDVRVSTEVEGGDELKVGFIIEDEAGEMSNDPWLVLQALSEGS